MKKDWIAFVVIVMNVLNRMNEKKWIVIITGECGEQSEWRKIEHSYIFFPDGEVTIPMCDNGEGSHNGD